MFGLDSLIAHYSAGATLAIVVVVAILLGLRHASDPDHLAAVTTLVTNGRGGATRLGLAWGLGHASSLAVFVSFAFPSRPSCPRGARPRLAKR